MAAEKWITPPADVVLLDDDDKPIMSEAKDGEEAKPATRSFRKFMLAVLNHPRLTSSPKQMKAHNRVRRALKACQVGVPFSVTDEDHKLINAVLEDPDYIDETGGRQLRSPGTLAQLMNTRPDLLPQLEGLISAWTDAKSEKPAEEEPAA
jgi:hypothetical protein